jgi:hypothetical protein
VEDEPRHEMKQCHLRAGESKTSRMSQESSGLLGGRVGLASRR